MNFLARVEVLVLTWNEEANLARTLDALQRFPRVLVLDSGSTDATREIAARYPNVRVATRAFDTHAAQWNHGLRDGGIAAAWVLSLDADYVLPEALVDEIDALEPPPAVTAYRASFRYCIAGEPLSGSLYPPVKVLFRREGASYVQEGHTQRLVSPGEARNLSHAILHDDRKPFSAWLASQDRYARLECALLRSTPWAQLAWRDRLRRLVVVTPWLVPLYCLTVGRGFLDGRRGLFYALQRAIAETLLAARLVEAQLSGREHA
ncbi:glycosyltransferase family 2 protein [Caenimonas aquaedulcis]|uniref:Glycosyltransferase family 2 protein n=1 Tax=Caenimonas aquaedulcis TaxID=2793270 RepID=A0A931MHG4_9BURK|nr:glycosyltransferase family 2 protein [Caenimonas aquaedulcis]MBG9389056.1 glycosyltransferase family 2 protein [Caenimonas aquaedulcis]